MHQYLLLPYQKKTKDKNRVILKFLEKLPANCNSRIYFTITFFSFYIGEIFFETPKALTLWDMQKIYSFYTYLLNIQNAFKRFRQIIL